MYVACNIIEFNAIQWTLPDPNSLKKGQKCVWISEFVKITEN